MIDPSEVVLLYGPFWDAPARLSKHHLARYWAQTRRVLYVDSPPNPLSFYTRREEAVALWKRYRHGPIKLAERLWIHTYLYPLPYRGSFTGFGGRWVNTFNQMVIRGQLLRSLQHLEFERPVLFVCSAHALPLVNHIPHRLLVYHCSDDYTLVPSFPASFPELEAELIRRCDVVITTTEELGKAKAHLTPNLFTVKNGADVKHFARTQAPETPLAPELASLSKPVVGYVGSVFRWINQEWVRHAATELRDWNFVFVGPQQTDVSLLRSLPNVHFLGPRPYSDLPQYLRGFHVAIVPFAMNELTLRASPIKFYEYLASGLPIVATRLPDLEPLEHLVGLVRTAAEFVEALQEAVQKDSPAARKARMSAAEKHSWEARFKQIDAVLMGALERCQHNKTTG
ncbi:glycosyltransferase [Acidobacteria bacterium AH-259-A15]|nr:glycosyltransferase [Acidobacteria bacterium AH-259-A15]